MITIRKYWHDPFYGFIIKAFLLYIVWYVLYQLVLHTHTSIDRFLVDHLAYNSGWLLEALGYELMPFPPPEDPIRTVGIDGSVGVWIGDPCNGLDLFALFAGFIIAYPGKLMSKFWFIPLGLIIIHVVNLLRVTALAMIVYYHPDSIEFNHTYTFTILVYGIVFLLWIFWVKRYGYKRVGHGK